MKANVLYFIAVLTYLSYSNVFASDENYVVKEKGVVITFEEKALYKIAPQLLVLQAKESLPHLEKDVQFHCERNYGAIGELLYSMLCYSSSGEPGQIQIIGELRLREKFWNYETKLPKENLVNNTLVVIELLSRFAYNKVPK